MSDNSNNNANPNANASVMSLAYFQSLGLTILSLEDRQQVAPGLTLIATGMDPRKVAINLPSNDKSAIATHTDLLRSTIYLGGTPLSGSGVHVGVWDEGAVLSSHHEFADGSSSRVVVAPDAGAVSDHATLVAGTIGAAGLMPGAEGMAPQVAIESHDWKDDTVELADAASRPGSPLLLSNHSYALAEGWNGAFPGVAPTDWWVDDPFHISADPDFGLYTAQTQALDNVLHANKNLLSVWAAGNDRNDQFTNLDNAGTYVAWAYAGDRPEITKDGWYLIDPAAGGPAAPAADGKTGYDSLPPMQTAKDSLVVGAMSFVDWKSNTFTIADASNWGPTSDGRLGVELMAYGADVYSSSATSNGDYGTYSGTSAAAASVTGSMALLYELHNKLDALDSDNYEHVLNIDGTDHTRYRFLDKPTAADPTITPLSSTMKDLAIHTAHDLQYIGPDYKSGYGLLDAKAAGDFLSTLKNSPLGNKNFLVEDVYTGTDDTIGAIRYGGGSGGIKATLVWNDPAATLDNPAKMLVNDLDLYLEGPNGKYYYPWTMNTQDPTAPAHSAVQKSLNTALWGNHLDNVEQVFIPQSSAPAGKYIVHVAGQLGAGNASQEFSIMFTALPKIGDGHGWGDVHMRTFDGIAYDMQQDGEFVFIESKSDGWQVQTRQEPYGNSTKVSVNTAFATTMDGYTLVFNLHNPGDQRISVDGAPLTLASGQSQLLNTSQIERQGNNYILTWAGPDGTLHTADDDVVTAVDGGAYINLYAKPADYRAGSVQGFMGNADGDSGNDFTLRDGTLLSVGAPTVEQINTVWADSWRVSQGESLFGTPTFDNPNFPYSTAPPSAAALEAAKIQIQQAAAGSGGITDTALLDAAALDVAETGNVAFIAGAVANAAQKVTLEVSPAAVAESGGASLVYTFARSGNLANAVTVNFAVGGSAGFGADYTQTGAASFNGAQGTVSFAVGADTAQVLITPKADNLAEAHESVSLRVSSGANYNVGTLESVGGTILDDQFFTPRNQTVAYTEDTPAAIADMVINDPNTAKTFTASIALAGGNSNIGSLSAASGHGESYNAAAGVWTVAGAEAAVNAALAAVSFIPAANVNQDTSATVSISDGIAPAVSGTLTFKGVAVNDAPTLSAFAPPVAAGDEDSAIPVTFASLQASGDEADIDGSVVAFVVKSVSGGTLKIGAAAWAAGSNATIDAAHTGYWTPAANANGLRNAFAAVAKDNGGLESATPVQAAVSVAAVNDAPVLAAPAPIVYTDTPFDDKFGVATGSLSASDVDGNVLAYGIVGGVDNGATVSLAGTYGVLTVGKASGAYTFAPNDAAIEPLSAAANSGFTVTVSDGALSSSKPLIVNIVQNGKTESGGNDTLVGTAGNDLFDALAGNDSIDGKAGADLMRGGLGDDTYYVDNVGDVVIEGALAGTDTVNSSISYLLSPNVENLILAAGTAPLYGAGNALNNTLTGNAGDNGLDGGAGADILRGGLGNDTYFVDNINDTVVENAGAGTDTVNSTISYTLLDNVENLVLTGAAAANGTGNALGNTLVGNSLANLLDGKAGADKMSGDVGNDTYVVDNTGDTVVELVGAGVDMVQSAVSFKLPANVENLALTGAAAVNATGNELNNVISGNAGDNTLDGGAGADSLAGGAGNDVYIVDNTADTVTESGGAGTDRVVSSVGFALPANVENLVLTGSANINGTGNALNNAIAGNSGDNLLDGGSGIDSLAGGPGNDTYIVDNTGDTVTEDAGAGADLVQSSVSYSLPANVENLTLAGPGNNINATGNSLDNVLAGNAGGNAIAGGGGADTIYGGGGADKLTGGDGSDTFSYKDPGDSGLGPALRDIITDFAHGQDKIDLTGLVDNTATGEKGHWLFMTSGQFSPQHTGEIVFSPAKGGAEATLGFDLNGDGAADFQIQLSGVTAFTAADLLGAVAY